MGNKVQNKRKISLDGKEREVIDDRGILRDASKGGNKKGVSGHIDSLFYSKKPPFEYVLYSNDIDVENIFKYSEVREICELLYRNRFAYICFCIGNKIYGYTDSKKLSFYSAIGFNSPIIILGGKLYKADKIYLRYFFTNEDIVQKAYLKYKEKEKELNDKFEKEKQEELQRRREKEVEIYKNKILLNIKLPV